MATEEPNAPAANGGFPEPPEGEPVRVVRCSHLACGAETRIRLPADLPTRVVHRVVCARCATAYDTASVEDLGVPHWRRRIGHWLDRPPGKRWQLFAIPVAAALVVEAIFLLNSLVGSGGGDGGEPARAHPRLVQARTWSLVLPASWSRVQHERGAAFAARSRDGTGDATLTVTREPSLPFAAFEHRSLARLRRTAGSSRVAGGGAAPGASSAELSGGAPSETGGAAPYTVALHASGQYRYYLQTSLSPGASPAAVAGARRIQGSFKPRRAPRAGS